MRRLQVRFLAGGTERRVFASPAPPEVPSYAGSASSLRADSDWPFLACLRAHPCTSDGNSISPRYKLLYRTSTAPILQPSGHSLFLKRESQEKAPIYLVRAAKPGFDGCPLILNAEAFPLETGFQTGMPIPERRAPNSCPHNS